MMINDVLAVRAPGAVPAARTSHAAHAPHAAAQAVAAKHSAAVASRVAPVSYTHLDVYKRQGYATAS